MAKIVIAGDAVVITSALKLEDIKTIAKYNPKALTLMGGEDGKEPIFAIGVTNGPGSINDVGASFGRESYDDEKLAVITMVTVLENLKEVLKGQERTDAEDLLCRAALEGIWRYAQTRRGK